MNKKIMLGECIFTVFGIVLCIILFRVDAFNNIKQWGLECNIDEKNNYYSSQVGFYSYDYAALTRDTEIVQELKLTEGMLEDAFLNISLLFGTFQRENNGEFCVELLQGEMCKSQTFFMNDVEESVPFTVQFTLDDLNQGSINLRIRAVETSENQCVATYIRVPYKGELVGMDMRSEKKEDTKAMFAHAIVNGIEQSGPLAMEIYTCSRKDDID